MSVFSVELGVFLIVHQYLLSALTSIFITHAINIVNDASYYIHVCHSFILMEHLSLAYTGDTNVTTLLYIFQLVALVTVYCESFSML